MFFLDSDNALGSWKGDVDDAFAIAAVLRSGLRTEGLASVFGNTAEASAARNNRRLAEVLGWEGALHRGGARAGDTDTEASRAIGKLRGADARLLALGPLTNVAGAIARGWEGAGETIIVGANLTSPGRWPPLYPFEFNLTRDRAAAITVFRSHVPLTVVPLDVARGLRMHMGTLRHLRGPVGDYLAHHAHRWLRFRREAPVWDLVAALYALDATRFTLYETTCEIFPNAWVKFRSGSRRVRVVGSYDAGALWSMFETLLG